MLEELKNSIEKILIEAKKEKIEYIKKREIPYGVQLIFEYKSQKGNINIYFSKKKGISFVLGGKIDKQLYAKLCNLVGNKQPEAKKHTHNWSSWIGTDESGKGDFFGPLVVAGFLVNKKAIPNLKKIGVSDSKILSDEQNTQIAQLLKKMYPKSFRIFTLNPENYNEFYANFREKGQKLNEMMIWMHTDIVLQMAKEQNFEGVIIDKFASQKALDKFAPDEFKKFELIFKIQAESDIAVAAASIIARAEFLRQMKILSKKYGVTFHKGASYIVKKDAREFIEKFSKEDLHKVCKVHFKTYQELIGDLNSAK